MGHFYYAPKKFNDNALGYYIKLMGHYCCIANKPITLWSHRIYPSEQHVLNSFVQAWWHYFNPNYQVVCCAYDTQGRYQFSFVRDYKSGKFTKIETPENKLPRHMRKYEFEFIPAYEGITETKKSSKAKK